MGGKHSLSQRMAAPGNLWRELWDDASLTAPQPACEQPPLFDYTSEAERVLHFLETIPPVLLLLELLIAHACALSGHLRSCPHARHPTIVKSLARLDAATASLAKLTQQLAYSLELSDDDSAAQQEQIHLADIATTTGEVVGCAGAVEKMVSRASTLHAELRLGNVEQQRAPGRFAATVLRPLLDALLNHGVAAVERAAEREAVTGLFSRT